MPQKLETVLKHVEEISNDLNRQLIKDYHKYLIGQKVILLFMIALIIGRK